jgi:hypothetical protein
MAALCARQPLARLGAQATTTFGVDPVPLVEQATRLEFAGGVTAKLTPIGA